MNREKWIVWDFNGTVLDDAELSLAVLNKMLAKRKLPELTMDRYMEAFGFPIKEFYRAIGFDFTQWPYEGLAVEYMKAYMPASMKVGLRPGALDSLRQCRDAGCRQVLLSATNLDYLKTQLTNYGIAPYFDEVLGLSHIRGTGKVGVARGWIRKILQDPDRTIDPSRVVSIGDTEHDFEVTRAMTAVLNNDSDSDATVKCVLVTGGHNSRTRLEKMGAAAVADDVPEAVAKSLQILARI